MRQSTTALVRGSRVAVETVALLVMRAVPIREVGCCELEAECKCPPKLELGDIAEREFVPWAFVSGSDVAIVK